MNINKVSKTSLIAIAGLLLLYVASVGYFEAQLGYSQPQNSASLVIATLNDDNERHERVLRLKQIDGLDYIAANHWPRAWYH